MTLTNSIPLKHTGMTGTKILVLACAGLFFVFVAFGAAIGGGYWYWRDSMRPQAPLAVTPEKSAEQRLADTANATPAPARSGTQVEVLASPAPEPLAEVPSPSKSQAPIAVSARAEESPAPIQPVPLDPVPVAPTPAELAQFSAEAAARELDKSSADAQSEVRLFALLQQKQADEFGGTLAEYVHAGTAEKRAAAKQHMSALNESDGRVRDFYEHLMQRVDDLNRRLAQAGKPAVAGPQVDAEAQQRIETTRANFEALFKAPTSLPTTPVVVQANEPPPPPLLPPPSSTRPLAQTPPAGQRPSNYYPPAATPPALQVPQPLPPPPVVVGVSGADVLGGWRRADGKVSWVFDPRGIMSSHMSGKGSFGTWTFDDKTGTVGVQLNGFNYGMSISRSNDVWIMQGSAGGAAPIHFTKIAK